MLWIALLTLTTVSSSICSPSVQNGQNEEYFPKSGKKWRVSDLGMEFVPIPKLPVLFSIWNTRVKDFAAFVSETGYNAEADVESNRGDGARRHGDNWRLPGFPQNENNPVVGINIFDARAFCSWLTERERREHRLGPNQSFRLPTDAEWSAAAGLLSEPNGSPRNKEASGEEIYPWGPQWPPPLKAGNYSWSLHVDDFQYTSPVGSFTPNHYGLYDMG